VGYELISLVYPFLCRACDRFVAREQVFCSDCFSRIKKIPPSFISLTTNISIKIYSVSDYKEPLRSLILRKKSSDRLAARQLGEIMSRLDVGKFDYLIPVPLHWTRYARRGFNQSREIACVLSKKFDIPVVDLLKRAKRTRFQSNLSHDLRQDNVDSVFVVQRKYHDIYCAIVRGKNVLLVDDLCTTGATLKNVARPLLAGQPRSISAIVACRVV